MGQSLSNSNQVIVSFKSTMMPGSAPVVVVVSAFLLYQAQMEIIGQYFPITMISWMRD
jgi:hypothetical protein